MRRRGVPAVHFLDVTNRDGVQTARTGLSKFGKTMINFAASSQGHPPRVSPRSSPPANSMPSGSLAYSDLETR